MRADREFLAHRPAPEDLDREVVFLNQPALTQQVRIDLDPVVKGFELIEVLVQFSACAE